MNVVYNSLISVFNEYQCIANTVDNEYMCHIYHHPPLCVTHRSMYVFMAQLSRYSSIYVLIYICTHLSMYSSIYVLNYLYTQSTIYILNYLYTQLSMYSSIYVLNYLYTQLSIYSTIYILNYLCTQLSIYSTIYVLNYLYTQLSMYSTTYILNCLCTQLSMYSSIYVLNCLTMSFHFAGQPLTHRMKLSVLPNPLVGVSGDIHTYSDTCYCYYQLRQLSSHIALSYSLVYIYRVTSLYL